MSGMDGCKITAVGLVWNIIYDLQSTWQGRLMSLDKSDCGGIFGCFVTDVAAWDSLDENKEKMFKIVSWKEETQQVFDMRVSKRDLLSVQMRLFMEELLTFLDNYDKVGSIASISSL